MPADIMLTTSLAEARLGQFQCFKYQDEFLAALTELWAEPVAQPPTKHFAAEPSASYDAGIRFSRHRPEPTPWTVAFTPTFRKSVAGMDKKLQGRVLGALGELSERPVSPQGDTIKPLVGDRKGLWRYRIGDYRLVYEPQDKHQIIVLLEFSARGDIYD